MLSMTDVVFNIFLNLFNDHVYLKSSPHEFKSYLSQLKIHYCLIFSLVTSINYYKNIIKYDDIRCDDLIILGIILFSGSNRDINDIQKDMCHQRRTLFSCYLICLIKHKHRM